jgi:GR25 family glycosyltransferase involved in LPS biosynthesis
MTKVNDFFDKIYCINLPNRTDKWKECEIEFQKHSLIVERFDAKRGKQTGHLTPGEVGLIETNIDIFRDAISKGYKKILILEDDVVFHEKFNEKFESKIDVLPDDWETLHIGGNHFFHMGEFKSINNNYDFPINGSTYRQIDHDICKTFWSQTTHAVGINHIIFEKVLEAALKMDRQIDNVYCEFQRSGLHKTYAFIPSICLQRPSVSDIQGGYVDYNQYKHYFF